VFKLENDPLPDSLGYGKLDEVSYESACNPAVQKLNVDIKNNINKKILQIVSFIFVSKNSIVYTFHTLNFGIRFKLKSP
jgi:hypothetical protein